MTKKKKNFKNPYHLTFTDALNAATFLVKQEHLHEKPCPKCRMALEMIKKLKKYFQLTALDRDLVWHAHKGQRILYVGK